MNTANVVSDHKASPTPLANLFSYIRDLFHTAEPILDFKSQKTPYWPLQQLDEWAEQLGQEELEFQYQDVHAPFLTVSLIETEPIRVPAELQGWVEIESNKQGPDTLTIRQERNLPFEADDDRVQAFESFSHLLADKPLEEVLKEAIPLPLRGWVELKLENDQVNIGKKDKRERLNADAHRVQMLEMFKRVFEKQATQNWYATQANQLYERLHTLYYELRSQPQTQLYLSFGLVSGKMGSKNYQNFLFHVPMLLQLTQQTLQILPDPLAFPVLCEQTFAPLLPVHFAEGSPAAIEQKERDVVQLVEAFNHRAIGLSLSPEYISEHFYQTASEIVRIFPKVEDSFFGPEGWLLPDIDKISENAIKLTFTPVFQVRKEEPRLHISRDAGKIVEKLQEMDLEAQRSFIPDFFKKLFSLRSPDNPLRVVHKKEETLLSEPPAKTKELDRPILFPLPYNEEQRAIVGRLAQEDAVTVQGPPGTGKSHTIANIMSHYAAQGKSVLIVSKYGKALDVIKNKLPASLQHLVLSWVESDQQHEQLKYAIDAIKEQLSRKYALSGIQELEQQLKDLDSRYQEIQTQLEQLLQPDRSSLSYINPESGVQETKSGAQWARWMFEHPEPLHYIRESYGELPEEKKDLAEKLARYITSRQHFTAEILRYVHIDLPDPETWLKVEQLIHYGGKLTELSKGIDLTEFQPMDFAFLSDHYELRWEEIQVHIDNLIAGDRLLENPAFSFAELTLLLAQHKEWVEAGLRTFWDQQFDLSPLEGMEPETMLEEALALRDKFGGNARLSLLKKNTLSKTHKKLLSCSINRLTIEKLTQVDQLIGYIEYLCKRKKLVIFLQNYYAKLGIPFEPEQVIEHLKQLVSLQEAQAALTKFNKFLEEQKLPPFDFVKGNLGKQREFFRNIPTIQRYREVESAFQTCLYPLRQSRALKLPLIHELTEKAEAYDVEGYKESLGRYRQFRNQVEAAKEWKETGNMLKADMPQTFTFAQDRIAEADDRPLPSYEEIHAAILSDLFRLELTHDLKMLTTPLSHTSDTFEELEDLKYKREGVVAQLIVQKTWYHKSQTLTDEQRAALTAWRNDIINIGKGHGKNADRNLSSAIQNMRRAKSVVPIWIMQQDTAIKFFADPEPGQFDLLIIDEASQCDISMVNLIFRAKKSMIVGDENQTAASIPSTLFPIERTNRILDRYLATHPFKEQFNINNRASSIYALSGVIFPNIVTLLEHFRCRPEIIGYSNRFVYNGQMVPLKTATENFLGEPLEAEYIEEESQKKKRIHIVARVKEILEEMVGQFESGLIPRIPSIGVLSLDSSNEPHLEHLIKVLAASKPVRRHADALDLLIGTARKFQGDERDVMILTSTAIHRKNAKGSLRPPRGLLSEEMMRIYNVAASRAREKCILLHCIAPEAVAAMNPNCYRKKLIDYYSDAQLDANTPKPTELVDILKKLPKEKEELYRNVCIFLFDKGYGKYVHTNYRLGTYQLDIALLNKGKKIAILFDSSNKKDPTARFNELITLKRVGWEFFYLPEMLWFYQGEEIQDKLGAWLETALS